MAPAGTSARECPFVAGKRASLPLGKVNYLLKGPPSAPLVVCLHGLNGSTASFESLAPHLEASGLRVLLFDWYGFGLSSTPRRPKLNEKTYVQQLLELLDAVGVGPEEKFMLLGFSMGGIMAIEFAREHPERVERLLLVAPGGLLLKEETPCQPFLFGCLRARCGCCVLQLVTCLTMCCWLPLWLATRRETFEGMFDLDVREPENFADVRQANSRRFTWDIRRSLTSYLRVLKSMPLWSEEFKSAYEDLAKSKVPVLFIWGDDDNTVPWWEVGAQVVELFGPKGASCIRIPGAGHGLLVEDAEEVSRYASAWFWNSSEPSWLELLQGWRLDGPQALKPLGSNGNGREPPSPSNAPAAEVVGHDAV